MQSNKTSWNGEVNFCKILVDFLAMAMHGKWPTFVRPPFKVFWHIRLTLFLLRPCEGPLFPLPIVKVEWPAVAHYYIENDRRHCVIQFARRIEMTTEFRYTWSFTARAQRGAETYAMTMLISAALFFLTMCSICLTFRVQEQVEFSQFSQHQFQPGSS